jgi:polyvinyl alcohol dehydrogenase (cytochrome)
VEADTGDTRWRTELQEGQLPASPAVDSDRVYISGDGGMVHAVDRDSGDELWSVDIEDAPLDRVWSSPVVVDGTIVIGSASYQVFVPAEPAFRGSIVGLDAETGELRWRTSVCDHPCTGVSVWSSAAADPDLGLAFIGTGQAYSDEAGPMSDSLVALDYETGEIAWHHQFTPDDTYSAGNLSGPDFDVGAAPNLFEIDGQAVVGVGDKGGQYKAFDRATGEELWATDLVSGTALGGVEHTPAYADGVIYVVGNTAIAATSRVDAVPATATAFALDATDGTILWSTDLEAGGFGGVSVAGDLMWFTTHEGTLRALDIDAGSEVAAISLGPTSASGPVVVDGTVFVGHGWSWSGSVPGGVVALAPAP